MDKDGRNVEFTEYVASRWTRLVRSAVLLGCSAAEAEDVVQAALTRCPGQLVEGPPCRRPRRLRSPDPFQYVHDRASAALDPGASGSRRSRSRPSRRHTAAFDVADALLRSLARLTPEQRAVVVLRYYAHLTEQQMTVVLGVPAGTIKSRLSRALKVLADDATLSEFRGAR